MNNINAFNMKTLADNYNPESVNMTTLQRIESRIKLNAKNGRYYCNYTTDDLIVYIEKNKDYFTNKGFKVNTEYDALDLPYITISWNN